MDRRTFLAGTAASLLAAHAPPAVAADDTATHNRGVLDALLDLPEGVEPLDWQWIVVHHTATKKASLEGLDRYHRRHFEDPLGCQYHFVVNNGKKAPRGWIHVARWRHQARAIHLFHPERAPRAIAVCLVGNFEEKKVPAAMLDSTVALTRALMTACAIPVERVTTHRRVDGRLTQCPGKHFPFDAFVARLA